FSSSNWQWHPIVERRDSRSTGIAKISPTGCHPGAERSASGAARSGSAADAVRRRLHAVVRPLRPGATVQRKGTAPRDRIASAPALGAGSWEAALQPTAHGTFVIHVVGTEPPF